MVNRYRPRSSDSLHSPEMPPLLLYLPFIVWTGVIEVLMDATIGLDEQKTTRRAPAEPPTASIIHFAAPAAALSKVNGTQAELLDW